MLPHRIRASKRRWRTWTRGVGEHAWNMSTCLGGAGVAGGCKLVWSSILTREVSIFLRAMLTVICDDGNLLGSENYSSKSTLSI